MARLSGPRLLLSYLGLGAGFNLAHVALIPPYLFPFAPEVNLVNLERVGFNLRNFDMMFIWKDLNRDVGRIDSIPSTSLDTIKVRGVIARRPKSSSTWNAAEADMVIFAYPGLADKH